MNAILPINTDFNSARSVNLSTQQPDLNHQQSDTRAQNKPTEFVKAKNESQTILNKPDFKENTFAKNSSENSPIKSDAPPIDIKEAQYAKDKIINRNIAEAKITDDQKVDKPQNNIKTDRPTAAEEAATAQNALEDIKTVKPDGTETYYFPVPVAILSQLPPPGNVGIPPEKLNQMIHDMREAYQTETKKLEQQKQSDEMTDTRRIEINHEAQETQHEISNQNYAKNISNERLSNPNELFIDYGLET